MFEKVRSMLAQQLDLDPATITMETHLIEDLSADSLDVVELIMSLEDEYGVLITDEKASELVTVGAIVRFLETL